MGGTFVQFLMIGTAIEKRYSVFRSSLVKMDDSTTSLLFAQWQASTKLSLPGRSSLSLSGSAVEVNRSLFSRRQGICDTIFGGGDDEKPVDSPDSTRKCTAFVGNGLCTGSGSVYPNCVKTGMTLEDCQQAAVDKIDAVGLSHGTWSGDVGCGLFFDVAFEFSCPDGYSKVSDGSLQGTGPVTGFFDYPVSDEVCYKCIDE